MKRLSRVVVPLLSGIGLVAVWWFLRHNRSLIDRLELDAELVPRIVLFLALIAFILAAVRAVDLLVFETLAKRRSRVRAPMLLREMVSTGLFFVLLAWAIGDTFKYQITALLATGTVVAAVLGLALQETLGNLFAGIALHLEEDFKVGDVIRSGENIGVVEALRWRGTRIRTVNNNVVIVPNSVLARERLEVFPHHDHAGRVLTVGVDYNVPPARVIDVLAQAASNVEGVTRDQPCIARVADFGDSAVIYEIKYYTSDYANRQRIDADVRKAVWYALRRNEIPIPFPIRSLERYTAPKTKGILDSAEIVRRLSRIDILSPLTSDALETIAAAAAVHVYAKGETILRIGSEGKSMFVVHEGSVSVRVQEGEVAQLLPGDFFGEMALLTGERRTADIVALTEVVAIEIEKDAVQPILHEHPELASAISARVIERRKGLDSVHEEIPEEAEATVLSRIRAYFGL